MNATPVSARPAPHQIDLRPIGSRAAQAKPTAPMKTGSHGCNRSAYRMNTAAKNRALMNQKAEYGRAAYQPPRATLATSSDVIGQPMNARTVNQMAVTTASQTR